MLSVGITTLLNYYLKSRVKKIRRKSFGPIDRVCLLDPLIKNLSAELSAGTRRGESLLDLKVTKVQSFDAKVTFDNSRSPSVDTDRRRISYA